MKTGFVITTHYSDHIRPNGQELLNRILNSITENCKTEFNIYIVDNSSQYPLLYPKNPQFKYFRIEDQYKKGLTGAWNLGINEAYKDNCDIIINCNDDLWFNSSINKLIESISKHDDSDNIIFQGVTNGIGGGGPRYGTSPRQEVVKLICTDHSNSPHGYCFAMTKDHYTKYRYKINEYFNKDNKYNGGDGKWGGQEGQFQENGEKGAYGLVIGECFIEHDKIRDWTKAKAIENNKMKISLIQPGRNNLKYLKWSYDSIRKNQDNHEVQICVADDASTDGTWDWCLEMMDKDPNFNAIKNDTGERLGHTILYDRLINEVAKHDVCMIYHADMYLCPGALDAIKEHLTDKTIVSLTRIEPPLHPDGPEKILRDFGVEPEEFNEEKLIEWFTSEYEYENITKTTEGIFAPWAFYKKDFQEIGGHDPLYAPQSKEDSDIFNRFQLNGIKFIQTWKGCVYHMTCRGSRRNTVDKAKNIYEDSPEWLAQNQRSTRNFIRKWGHFVKHDTLMKPIIPPKYDIGIILEVNSEELLNALEPWCSNIYCGVGVDLRQSYITKEQPNTIMDLSKRVLPFHNEKNNEILVTINNKFTQQDFQYIQQLSEILADSGEPGFHGELGNITVEIFEKMNTYENELIKL